MAARSLRKPRGLGGSLTKIDKNHRKLESFYFMTNLASCPHMRIIEEFELEFRLLERHHILNQSCDEQLNAQSANITWC